MRAAVAGAPMNFVGYVVAYELVHVVHEEHRRESWARLGRAMPDYEERREMLRKRGGEMVW